MVRGLSGPKFVYQWVFQWLPRPFPATFWPERAKVTIGKPIANQISAQKAPQPPLKPYLTVFISPRALPDDPHKLWAHPLATDLQGSATKTCVLRCLLKHSTRFTLTCGCRRSGLTRLLKGAETWSVPTCPGPPSVAPSGGSA